MTNAESDITINDSEKPVPVQAPETPLALVPAGSTVRLARLDCGREMAMRLASMGLRVGVTFDVVRSSGCGPVIVGISHARYALGRGMTTRMMTRPASKTQ